MIWTSCFSQHSHLVVLAALLQLHLELSVGVCFCGTLCVGCEGLWLLWAD